MAATVRDTSSNIARTLRLSITGECNLNCFYCRSLGLNKDLTKTKDLIQASDATKLVKIVGDLGVRKVVIGGAEPLLRKDAANFIKAAYGHRNIQDVVLVTNGTFLRAFADSLRKMGLKKVVVYFDSLNFIKYQKITGRDSLYRVLDGIDKIEKLGFIDVRLNILLLNGINESEIVEFARMTKDRKLHIRFMEYHPRVMQAETFRERLGFSVLTAKAAIDNYQTLIRIHDLEEEIPVPTFQFRDGTGKISFLSKMEIEQEFSLPRVVFTPEGILMNEAIPNRRQAILADLRRDAKETRLHRVIEKILSLQGLETKKPTPTTSRRVATLPALKSKMKSRSAHASAR